MEKLLVFRHAEDSPFLALQLLRTTSLQEPPGDAENKSDRSLETQDLGPQDCLTLLLIQTQPPAVCQNHHLSIFAHLLP